jgi:hypothetical protein
MAVGEPAFAAITAALEERNFAPYLLGRYERASLTAVQEADIAMRALGTKKLKELRRQWRRLADSGEVEIVIATTPKDVASALEDFLSLEASGWKGQRGTAMLQNEGHAAFIRSAASALARKGQFEILSLKKSGAVVACGLVLRQAGRAFFFKLAYDEALAKASPGVQLTLGLTRHLCNDPNIHSADSMADAEHSMINHIWRDRMLLADVFIPLRVHDQVTSLTRNLVAARNVALDGMRPVVHFIRRLKDQLADRARMTSLL